MLEDTRRVRLVATFDFAATSDLAGPSYVSHSYNVPNKTETINDDTCCQQISDKRNDQMHGNQKEKQK